MKNVHKDVKPCSAKHNKMGTKERTSLTWNGICHLDELGALTL